MSQGSTDRIPSHCITCGFEAGTGEWEVVEAPPLGEITQCPECGSTNVVSGSVETLSS